jgi:hypothetical protein
LTLCREWADVRPLVGEEGFEKPVAQVAAITRQMGIRDLAQFTPR